MRYRPAVEEEIQFSPAEQSLQSAAQKQTLNQSGEDIEAQEYNPEEMVFYYFGGMAYYQKDKEDEALREFRLGLAQVNAQSLKRQACSTRLRGCF